MNKTRALLASTQAVSPADMLSLLSMGLDRIAAPRPRPCFCAEKPRSRWGGSQVSVTAVFHRRECCVAVPTPCGLQRGRVARGEAWRAKGGLDEAPLGAVPDPGGGSGGRAASDGVAQRFDGFAGLLASGA